MFDRSHHYTVLAKIRIRYRQEYDKSNDNGKVSEVVAKEKMGRKEVKEVYQKGNVRDLMKLG